MAAEEIIVDPDFYTSERRFRPLTYVIDVLSTERIASAELDGAAPPAEAPPAHGAPSGRVRVALLDGRELALDGEPDALLGEGDSPALRAAIARATGVSPDAQRLYLSLIHI